MPTVLIIHSLSGAKTKQRFCSTQEVDQGHSSVMLHAYSTVRPGLRKGNKQPSVPVQSESFDKVVSGYSGEGLPFLIVAHSSDNNNSWHSFIQRHVTVLMSDYALKLARDELQAKPIIEELINDIGQLKKNFARFKAFSLAIAISFKDSHGQLRVAGFSIANTGIALLADSPYGHQRQLAFSSNSEDDIKIKNAQIFCEQITVGDELVAYSLPLSFQTTDDLRSLELCDRDDLFLEKREDISLLDAIEKTIRNQESNTEYTRSACTVAAVIIPDEALQIQLIKKLRNKTITAIENATKSYLDWLEENASGHRGITRWSHFFHGSKGRERAERMKQLITDLKAIPESSERNIELAYQNLLTRTNLAYRESGCHQHSYSRYLNQAFNPISPMGKTDEEFKQIKNSQSFL